VSDPAQAPHDRQPRILLVTTVFQTLRAFLLPFLRHLRAEGWHVEAATRAEPDAAEVAPEVDALHGVSWARDAGALDNLRAVREVRRVVKDGGFDVVHVHTPIAALVTRIAVGTLRQRPAVVYTAHGFHFYEGGDPRRNLAFRTAEKIGGRWTDRLVVINSEDHAAALKHRIVPADRLRLFPGIGVDLAHYAPTPEMLDAGRRLRVDLGIAPGTTVYTMLAEFQPGKNHRTAIDAFSRLPDRDARLLLGGGGPLEADIRAQVEQLGLTDRVMLLGMVADVRPLLLTSAAMVLPSRREGLSRSALEALALGVPVVGGDTRGIRDLVDPDLGVLVDPDDVEGLARAMTDVLKLPAHDALRELSRERMQKYSIERVVALHDELYAELLAARANGRATGR
jgi:glycosyltransferase involved in cell wall biosynthesis